MFAGWDKGRVTDRGCVCALPVTALSSERGGEVVKAQIAAELKKQLWPTSTLCSRNRKWAVIAFFSSAAIQKLPQGSPHPSESGAATGKIFAAPVVPGSNMILGDRVIAFALPPPLNGIGFQAGV